MSGQVAVEKRDTFHLSILAQRKTEGNASQEVTKTNRMGPVSNQLTDGGRGGGGCLVSDIAKPYQFMSSNALMPMRTTPIREILNSLSGPFISIITLRIHPVNFLCNEGPTEEANNGHVVFKGNIHGGGRRRYSACP